jgi:hypothetical protein
VLADGAGEPPQPVKPVGAKRIRGEPQDALPAGRIDREACGARPLLAAPAQDRRLGREQIAEWQILAKIERLENLR